MADKIKTGLLNLGLKFISIDEKIFRMILETAPSNVNEIVILPAIKIVMEKIIKKLKDKSKHGYIYNGKLSDVKVSVIQSLVGCPYIAEKMECLKFTKCKAIIRLDFCGGLNIPSETIEPGKIIIPEYAYCGDGTSPYYILKYFEKLNNLEYIENPIENIKTIKTGNERAYKVYPSNDLNNILVNTAKKNFPNKILTGPIWTTDAFFCETDDIAKSWIKEGIIGVDMESSLLFLLGNLFNIQTASVVSISDVVGHEKYDIFKSNYIHPEIYPGIDKAIEIVVKSLKEIENRLEIRVK